MQSPPRAAALLGVKLHSASFQSEPQFQTDNILNISKHGISFSQGKDYSILQIPRVSFLDQAMHAEACLGLPVLPVKQTGHLNVPPIPSKLCSIR